MSRHPLISEDGISRLPKKLRLKSRHEFLKVQRRGVRMSGSGLTMLQSRTLRPYGRIGFTVPKAVGSAVVRNRIKRRLRHISRENKLPFLSRDLVVIALKQASTMSFKKLLSEYIRLSNFLQKRHKSSSLTKKS